MGCWSARPLAARPAGLLDALAGCVDVEDALSSAICQSVTPFLQHNEIDDSGSTEQDIVWLVAALEQLFGSPRGAAGCAARRATPHHDQQAARQVLGGTRGTATSSPYSRMGTRLPSASVSHLWRSGHGAS